MKINSDLHLFESHLESAMREEGIAVNDINVRKVLDNPLQNPLSPETDRIISRLNEKGYTAEKIGELSRGILFQPPKGPIPLEFICGVDHPDHNGCILDKFNEAIHSGHPVITNRALLLWAENPFSAARDLALPKIAGGYDIYGSGPFLVFIPKILEMEMLDLNPTVLKPLTLGEAWALTEEKLHFTDFLGLFTYPSKHDKIVHIAGHGHVGSPAGLTGEHYKEFLEWADRQQCKGLLVTSCYSGGESTLLHFGSPEDSQSKGVQFPVLVRSIGDFQSKGHLEAENDTHHLFSKLTELFNAPGGCTVSRLRKVVQAIEKGKEKKPSENLLQVYFPHATGTSSGFRTVGEGGVSYPLTFNDYRKQQVEKGVIAISNMEFVELYPAIVQCPIVFTGSDAIFLSMIPGKALHLLTKVTLGHFNTEYFLEQNVKWYERDVFAVPKTLFIASLKSGARELNQVFINLQSGECGYRFKSKFFLWNVKTKESPKEVWFLQYFLRWKDACDSSAPKAAALRAATGGQQSIRDVEQHLAQETFWEEDQDMYNEYSEVWKADKLKNWIKEWNLRKQEMISLAGHFLIWNKQALACALYLEASLSPNNLDDRGTALIVTAAKHNCLEFFKIVDLADVPPNNLAACLGWALRMNHSDLIDLLLEHDSIDAETLKPMIYNAVYNVDNLKKVVARQPEINLDVDVITDEGRSSLLGVATRSAPIDSMQFLLERGVDPNRMVGDYSPLSEAIIRGNIDKIALLMKHGANPFKEDAGHHYPIREALARRSIEVVEELFQSFDEMTREIGEEEKKRMLSIAFVAAVGSGEEAKIRLLLSKNATLPSNLDAKEKEIMEQWFERLRIFGKGNLVKEIRLQSNVHL